MKVIRTMSFRRNGHRKTPRSKGKTIVMSRAWLIAMLRQGRSITPAFLHEADNCEDTSRFVHIQLSPNMTGYYRLWPEGAKLPAAHINRVLKLNQ